MAIRKERLAFVFVANPIFGSFFPPPNICLRGSFCMDTTVQSKCENGRAKKRIVERKKREEKKKEKEKKKEGKKKNKLRCFSLFVSFSMLQEQPRGGAAADQGAQRAPRQGRAALVRRQKCRTHRTKCVKQTQFGPNRRSRARGQRRGKKRKTVSAAFAVFGPRGRDSQSG